MARSGRYLARRCAVQALYQWALTGQEKHEIRPSFIKNKNLERRHAEYFETLISVVPCEIEKIDEVIHPHLDRPLEDIDLIEHAILRVACYELMYEKAIPTNVVLSEAIDLAKVFSAENSYKYINGVLDKIAKEARP